MLDFIYQNLGTIAVGAIVAAIIVFAALRTHKARKAGGCGCGCEGCASASSCHTQGGKT